MDPTSHSSKPFESLSNTSCRIHFMSTPVVSLSDLTLCSLLSPTTALSPWPETVPPQLFPHLISRLTICATTRATQTPPPKTPSVSSRTTCPVRNTISPATDALGHMSRTSMAPAVVSWSLTRVTLHGSLQMHPWRCNGTMRGSAASLFKTHKIRLTRNV